MNFPARPAAQAALAVQAANNLRFRQKGNAPGLYISRGGFEITNLFYYTLFYKAYLANSVDIATPQPYGYLSAH